MAFFLASFFSDYWIVLFLFSPCSLLVLAQFFPRCLQLSIVFLSFYYDFKTFLFLVTLSFLLPSFFFQSPHMFFSYGAITQIKYWPSSASVFILSYRLVLSSSPKCPKGSITASFQRFRGSSTDFFPYIRPLRTIFDNLLSPILITCSAHCNL